MALTTLSSLVQVSGQLQPDDMALLARQEFGAVINNRPDDEEPDQPSSKELAEAAEFAGLEYLHAPVNGIPNADIVQSVAHLLGSEAAKGRLTAMFCRSGMRSTATWAMAQRLQGTDADQLRAAAASAGYDLSRLPL